MRIERMFPRVFAPSVVPGGLARVLLGPLVVVVLAVGVVGGGAGCGDGSDELVHIETEPGCDDLNPSYCAYPWPSDRYLEEDDQTVTGYRLAYSDVAIPSGDNPEPFDLRPFRFLDGFSANTQILTLFDRLPDLYQVAYYDSIDRSLEPDSPTVLLDLQTGERLAHWVELDARAVNPAETTLYVRPAVRLEPNRSYAVALRDLVDGDGEALTPSVAFAALRDGQTTDSDELEARRESYEVMFAALEEAGVERGSLIMAWWWHTASFEAKHGTLLAMRDDALDRLGAAGLGCTVTEVEEDFEGISYRLVRATVETPWYLDQPEAPAEIVRDETGAPVYQGTEEVEFLVILPDSLASTGTAGPLVVWGHGLFGSMNDHITEPTLLQLAEDRGFVYAATNWAGMSSNELGFLSTALTDISQFYRVGEHVQQGMINQITLTRSMLGVCHDLPEMTADGTPIIDPEIDPLFVGGSQGSILGGTLLTISPDLDVGALMVGGGELLLHDRALHPLQHLRAVHGAGLRPAAGPRVPHGHVSAHLGLGRVGRLPRPHPGRPARHRAQGAPVRGDQERRSGAQPVLGSGRPHRGPARARGVGVGALGRDPGGLTVSGLGLRDRGHGRPPHAGRQPGAPGGRPGPLHGPHLTAGLRDGVAVLPDRRGREHLRWHLRAVLIPAVLIRCSLALTG
ncbi:hypothetical protein ACFL51_00445 [Myxococcota bacterium]